MNRRRIIKAAKAAGLQVIRLTWETVVYLEMGDCLGGWAIETNRGAYASITADGIIEWIQNHCDKCGKKRPFSQLTTVGEGSQRKNLCKFCLIDETEDLGPSQYHFPMSGFDMDTPKR